jgi:quinol monooxygenase YgiN
MVALAVRILSLVLVTLVALVAAAASPAQTAIEARYAVAYVEVQANAASAMRSAFQRYRDASRMEGGSGTMELLQQSGNSGLFVIIERWQDEASLAAHGRADSTTRFRDALASIRVSGYDERPYKDFAAGRASPGTAEAVYVVTHVDIAPPGDATALLRQVANQSRSEPGCLRFDVLQHAQRANHFTIVEAWRTRAARDRHVAAMHMKQYREALQPLIGSPLDERLMRVP